MANRFQDAVARIAPAATRTYPLYGVLFGSDKPVELHCRHAGFTNPGLASRILTGGAERAKLTAIEDRHASLIATSKHDAKGFAADCIVGWGNVIDGEGKPVPYTPELGEELLLAVIEQYLDLFVAFSNWVNTSANFRDTPIGDPVALGK